MFKSIEKVEPIEGAIMGVHIRNVVGILMATFGMFKGKYDTRARYDMYDFRWFVGFLKYFLEGGRRAFEFLGGSQGMVASDMVVNEVLYILIKQYV